MKKTSSKAVLQRKRRVRASQIDLPIGRWRIEANGFVGVLLISVVVVGGRVIGTVFGNAIRGWYDRSTGKITFVRFVGGGNFAGVNNQLYEGYIQSRAVGTATRFTLTGSFTAVGSGTTAPLNKFGWVATI
jgi:hypothetical protein